MIRIDCSDYGETPLPEEIGRWTFTDEVDGMWQGTFFGSFSHCSMSAKESYACFAETNFGIIKLVAGE